MDVIYLIVHCSETPDGRENSAADIHRWHTQDNNWSGIGYHAVIRRDGTIEKGRPELWPGAHARGHNDVSLGVCLIGTRDFTPEQMRSLFSLLSEWKQRYPEAHVIGHRDKDNGKTCPNFNVIRWWQGVNNAVDGMGE